MPRRQLITLPDGINPGGLITFRVAAEISGIPIKTLYEWRRTPGIGLRVYKIRKKIFLKCDEFLQWVNTVAQVPIGRPLTINIERGKDAPGTIIRKGQPSAVHGTSGAGRSFTNK